MKNTTILKIGTGLALFCAVGCGDGKDKKESATPGTVIATVSEPIIEDSLNKSTLSLKLIVDSLGNGVYDVAVDFGANAAVGKFTMPKGIEDVVPSVKKGKESYTYIIGFHLPDDTTFYEYYEVASSSATIKMRYLNSFSFK